MENNDKQPKYYHYIGAEGSNRYFKVDWENNKCVQVVLSAGEKKKGRPHCIGISHLNIMSFRSNYYWHYGRKSSNSRCLATSENQFKTAAIKVMSNML
jgi:hypothetical protein